MAITRRQRRLRKSSRCGRKIKSNGKRRHRRTKKVSGGGLFGSRSNKPIKSQKSSAADEELRRISQIPNTQRQKIENAKLKALYNKSIRE